MAKKKPVNDDIEQMLRKDFLELMDKTMVLRRTVMGTDGYWGMRARLQVAGRRYYDHCGWDQFYELANDACEGPDFGRRMAVMNSAMDGIGDWHA